MFIIRQKQMALLAKPAHDEFIRQLRIFVEEEYPEEVLLEDPAEVNKRFIDLVQKARSYGFVREQHVTLFVVFCLELGDDFDQQPAYASIVELLANKRIEPQSLLNKIGELIFE